MEYRINRNSPSEYEVVIDGVIVKEEEINKFYGISERLDLSDGKVNKVILNFKDCSFLDTRAIAVVLDIYRKWDERGVSIEIINADEEIKQFFKSLNLDSHIKIK